MSRSTVVWDPPVEAAFTQSWIDGDASTRAALTEVVNWVDKNLVEGADSKGDYRADLDARILAVPLSSSFAEVSVAFQAPTEDRQVRVVRLVFRLP